MIGRSGGGTPEAYNDAVEQALQSLAPFRDDVEHNMNCQGPLLEEILAENDRWDHSSNPAVENTLLIMNTTV